MLVLFTRIFLFSLILLKVTNVNLKSLYPKITKGSLMDPNKRYHNHPNIHNNGGNFNFHPVPIPPMNDKMKPNRINFRPMKPKDPFNIFQYKSFKNNNFGPNDFGYRGPPHVHKDFTPTRTIFTNHQPYLKICGRPIVTNHLIVQGTAVQKGAYPWLTAIYLQNRNLKYICSGSLVSNKHVVTAAHCVIKDNKKIKASDLLVVLGKLNIAKWIKGPGEKMIEPEVIYVHPDYDKAIDADIAIIVLSEAVKFSSIISPICLWDEPTDLDLGKNQYGVVAGWGKDEKGIKLTPEPRQIKLPIVKQETCLRSAPQFSYLTSNRTFCAGFLNKTGPCNGDSGSGFIMMRDSTWKLRGVVSMSILDTKTSTCDLKNYVIFTDASKFVPWILSYLE